MNIFILKNIHYYKNIKLALGQTGLYEPWFKHNPN